MHDLPCRRLPVMSYHTIPCRLQKPNFFCKNQDFSQDPAEFSFLTTGNPSFNAEKVSSHTVELFHIIIKYIDSTGQSCALWRRTGHVVAWSFTPQQEAGACGDIFGRGSNFKNYTYSSYKNVDPLTYFEIVGSRATAAIRYDTLSPKIQVLVLQNYIFT